MNRFAQAVSVSFLMLAAAGSLAAADFFPLAPGNSWTYRDAVTGQTINVRVGTQLYANQHVYHRLTGYTVEPVWVRPNQYGNLVYWNEELETDVLLTSFEFVDRAWFEAPLRECPEQGQVRSERGTHGGPAGPWNVIEIEYRSFACADAGDQLEQFTENIGMVRRVVTTIAGPRTFDLVRARVGSQLITSGSSGSFTVSAIPDPGQGAWEAMVRVDQRNGQPLKLRFPSGQEYDLRLRDERGNILWTWSADKLFVQAEHEREINGEWAATVAVPYPPAVPEEHHVYTLEAWLTTAETEPQFGAATTVETPAFEGEAIFLADPPRL